MTRRSPDGRKRAGRWRGVEPAETVPAAVLEARRQAQLEDVADSLAGALHATKTPYTTLSRRLGRDVRRTMHRAIKARDMSVKTLADVATALGMRLRVTFEPGGGRKLEWSAGEAD